MRGHNMGNVPSDWDAHWTKCGRCGKRYHLSDGGCECEDDPEVCPECGRFYDDGCGCNLPEDDWREER